MSVNEEKYGCYWMMICKKKRSGRPTIHPGQTVHQLADFNIQGVVTNIELVDRLVHAG